MLHTYTLFHHHIEKTVKTCTTNFERRGGVSSFFKVLKKGKTFFLTGLGGGQAFFSYV